MYATSLMLFGAHVSIRDGIEKAPARAQALGCECFQIFTRSPRGGPARPIKPATARAFRTACGAHGQSAWYIHTPYYINLASPVRRIYDLSVRVVREELERGRRIGATAVMTHLGGSPQEARGTALARAVEGMQAVLAGYRGRTRLLVENSAGAGSILGRTFEELRAVVRGTRGRCHVCLDTQHLFASGYDVRSRHCVGATLDRFDAVVGLRYLALIHANDSATELASNRDRHAQIGHGRIGAAGFRALVREPRLRDVDFVLELPQDGVPDGLAELARARRGVERRRPESSVRASR